MKKRTSNRPAFWTSIALHGLVVLIVVAIAIIDRFRTEDPVHVFEIVSLDLPPAPVPSPAPPTPPIPQDEPEPERLVVEQAEALREIPPAPQPTPPPPRPAPQPAPQPTPEPPRQIRFEDWAQNRNLPDRVQTAPSRPAPSAPAARIETNIRDRLRENLSDLQMVDYRASSSREQNEMEAYLNAIRARLRAAFEPVGVDHIARVRFEVAADGRIGRVDVVERSGNPVFDESVRRTFQTIGRFPPPPSGRAHSWTTTFRSTD